MPIQDTLEDRRGTESKLSDQAEGLDECASAAVKDRRLRLLRMNAAVVKVRSN